MKHYTYLIWNTITKRKYIGVRTAKDTPETDTTYYGSSKYLTEDIKMFGRAIFKKRILKCFTTRKHALEHEIQLHEKYKVNVSPNFYNKAKQTLVGFDSTGSTFTCLESTKKLISKANKGKVAVNKNILMKDKQKAKLSDDWEIIHPDGTVEEINNMRQFCIDHELNPSAMSKVARGKSKQHKKFRCRKLTEKRNGIKCEFTEWKSKGKPGKAMFDGDNAFAKKIEIRGTTYNSMTAASKSTGLSLYKLRKLGKFDDI